MSCNWENRNSQFEIIITAKVKFYERKYLNSDEFAGWKISASNETLFQTSLNIVFLII